MDALAILGTIVVGLIGLAGVGLTAWAGLRSNALRLAAERRQRAAEDAAAGERDERKRREAEAAALLAQRAQIIEYHEGLHATHRAEIDRLEEARTQEHAEVRRLRALLATREAPP